MVEEPEPRVNGNHRVESLVVVDIPVKQVENEGLIHSSWWHKLLSDPNVWVTITCSRVLCVTTRDHWEQELATRLPDLTTRCMTRKVAEERVRIGNPDPYTQSKPFFRKMEGWDGYGYLLETSCGLHSSDPGEEHISHQIMDEGYNQYKTTKHNAQSTWLDSIILNLKHDARQIRGITGPHIPPSEEQSARDLAGLNPGGDVLVVVDKWKDAHDMIRTLGKEAVKPKRIDVAHIAPRNNAIKKMEEQIGTMKEIYPSLPEINASSLEDVLAMGTECFATWSLSRSGK